MTVDSVLKDLLPGSELTVESAKLLFSAGGDSLSRLLSLADEVRRRRVGDRVDYVVNRNINFTNVCQAVRLLCFQRRSSSRTRLLLAT
jgi:FO synthase subunit 2